MLHWLRSTDLRTAFVAACLAAFVCGGVPHAAAQQADQTASSNLTSSQLEEMRRVGEEIYRSSCADCHGSEGQGVEGAYPEPLVGDDSSGQLADLIAHTMPEGAPEECVDQDARAVAEFIHYSFYSEAAQLRNRPPRISLARLTGTQLRQSLSDLYARFYGLPEPVGEEGVEAEYYDGDRWKRDKKKIDRIDPVIDFDFGHESPGEGISAEGFSIRWRGGLLIKETGRYEIVVRSTCSFVFNLGNDDREFINNHVQSGDKTEFRRSIVLTAGRVYPLEIRFRQRERKTELPPARISLAWRPPGGVEQVIPSQNLIAKWVPPAYALQIELPPDDRSYGYERGIAVSEEWDQSTTTAAIEFADIAYRELWPRYQQRNRSEKDQGRDKLRSFLEEIVQTAFRRPLTEAQQKVYIDAQLRAEPDDAEAVKRVMLLALKSPWFLYPSVTEGMSPSERVASHLALTLFDSLPSDEGLVEAARQERLSSEEDIREIAKTLVADYRVRAKTRQFLHGWLNIGHFDEIGKDNALFAGFDRELVAHLRDSLDAFLDQVVWSDDSDYRRLVSSDQSFTTEKIADFYGEAWKPTKEFSHGDYLVETVPSEMQAGVLTHPYMMSGLAYHDTTSPIHRGVFLIRYMLGRLLKPPADAFAPLSPDLHPDLTTRERVELQTSPESCQMCHKKINGLGFALEHFDAVGRYRTQERGKPIDATGSYITRAGEHVEFEGVQQLSDFLVTSDDAHRAFVSRAFQHFVKQPPAAYGPETLDQLTESFRRNEFNIRDLLIEICVVSARPLLAGNESKIAKH